MTLFRVGSERNSREQREVGGRRGAEWPTRHGSVPEGLVDGRADRLVGLRPDRSPDDQSVTDTLTRCFPPAHEPCLAVPRLAGEDEGDIRPIKTRSAPQYVAYDLVQVMEQPLSSLDRAANVFHQRSSASGRAWRWRVRPDQSKRG